MTRVAVALLALAACCVVAGCAASATRPAVPSIEHAAGWQLSAGCRVRQYGILTAPDCDILAGRGIEVQITRIRLSSLERGGDERTTIGIEFRTDQGAWSFSSPYADLVVAGKSHEPVDLDEAVVFMKAGRATSERLQPRQQRYQLPSGEHRFFRLRFAVPTGELRDGFALRVTGLRREGEVVDVPILHFGFN